MIRETTDSLDADPIVLGLDIGARSVGWALVKGTETGRPAIIDMGVRVFEAGVEGDIEAGKDSSRAAVRRLARQMRRQTARRVQRKRKLFGLLQTAGLLPASASSDSIDRDTVIKELDRRLLAALPEKFGSAGHTARKLPYVLRAEALRRPLSPDELGRILYHMGERRGFKSNRRTDRKAEDDGVVKSAIARIRSEKGDKTLGEFFADLDPSASRIRGRYLGRADYEDEFNRIWTAQEGHHALLTRKLRRRIRRCLFWQRPLKSAKALIGRCSLLTNRRRCPIAHPLSQEFRVLQAVNHLAIISSDGEIRGLSAEERGLLVTALMTNGDLTFPRVARALGLPRGSRFNLQEGGETRLVGNRTNKAMHEAIGDAWPLLSENDKTRLVGIVNGSSDSAMLRGQIGAVFPSLMPSCDALEACSLEDGFASHCKKVLQDLIERMRDGVPYATARQDFESTHGLGMKTDPVDQLPPVRNFLPSLTNPAVIRALTELRKVVNEVVRIHGKPSMIRIELARDLKKPRKIRQMLAKSMRDRERERAAATQQLKAFGIPNPSRADIEKVLLAEECGWACPYTGSAFGMSDIVGSHPMLDVEHIFPRRYLDDSFANKTLCVASENRAVKRDRLPSQAYAGAADRYQEILGRVGLFTGSLRAEKLRRFMADRVEDDFSSRQLIDTAYASRQAARYVGLLYGGVVDVRRDKRVRTSAGRLSGLLRGAWKLNCILGTDDSPKGRGIDHRHHAVDAAVIALTSDSLVKRVADAASSYAARTAGRWSIEVPEQEGLFDQTSDKIKKIIVSHRVDRRLNGRLHKDSFHGVVLAGDAPDARTSCVIRKSLTSLTPKEIQSDAIVDRVVRQAVREQYERVSEAMSKTKPEEVFADASHLPRMPCKSGVGNVIRRVRVKVRTSAMRVGDADHRARHVMQDTDGLHHTVIYSRRARGREVWEEAPTTRLEVLDRRRRDEPVVKTEWGADTEYVLHLCKGDSIELDSADGTRDVYIVKGVAGTDITVLPTWEARTGVRTADTRIRSADKLRQRHPQPVVVTPAGRVFKRGG